jgi:hypothetical protein
LHIAKVRFAGSNPVVRSKKHAGQGPTLGSGDLAREPFALPQRSTTGPTFEVADSPVARSRARSTAKSSLRKRGSGGAYQVRTGVFRIDVEVHRDAVTDRRRRVSRTVYATQQDAEVALARLKVADRERRLPQTATNARSVRALLDLYVQRPSSARSGWRPGRS